MNVLFHIDESLKWAMVLGNIQNMIQYFDQEAMHYRIELVANGRLSVNFRMPSQKRWGLKMLCYLFPQTFGSVPAAMHCAQTIFLLNFCCRLLKLSRQV